jgi:cell wall-associated NlpC family hydrolase
MLTNKPVEDITQELARGDGSSVQTVKYPETQPFNYFYTLLQPQPWLKNNENFLHPEFSLPTWAKDQMKFSIPNLDSNPNFLGKNKTNYVNPGVTPAKHKYPQHTPEQHCNNSINRIDSNGNTSEERDLALKTAKSLIGTAYKSALPKNERVKNGQLDCSGFVRYSMMQNSTIKDPFSSSGNGVTQIINVSRKVELKDIREGDLVVIKSGNNENGHIGFVKDIIRDKSGNVTQYTMLHSEVPWSNSSGQSGGGTIDEAIIKVGSEKGYAKSTYNHRFYQWDNPETSTTVKQSGNSATSVKIL